MEGATQKYPNGTKFKMWKYFDWDDKPIEGNYQIDCEVICVDYYNNPTLGTLYLVNPSEPIQCGDCNWNKTMETRTYISDVELDEYFSSQENNSYILH